MTTAQQAEYAIELDRMAKRHADERVAQLKAAGYRWDPEILKALLVSVFVRGARFQSAFNAIQGDLFCEQIERVEALRRLQQEPQ